MGLILPQTVKVRTNGMTCKHYREKGYTFEKCGDFIEVDVFDLPKGSHEMVKIICDVCGKESKIYYKVFVENRKKGILVSCGSDSCKNKKYEDTCTKRYGVKNAFQSEEVKEKIKDTNLERHGAENPFGSKEIQDKIKGTWQKNYGENITNPFQAESIKNKIKDTLKEKYGENIINISQVKEIQDKIKATFKERYGAENPMQCKEIQDKAKVTNLERHGVEYPTQNEEIKNKALDSFQFNGTGPCSRQQKYIHFLIGGALNKRVCNSLVDICFEEEKIAIEYDGGGHFLGDKMNGNKIPSKEALLKEKNREDFVVNKGYKVIRFIATKDRIPSDEVILNLIEEFKNSDFKIIRIDFEEGAIEKNYNEKTIHDFGELRRITKEDLEQFESKKQ